MCLSTQACVCVYFWALKCPNNIDSILKQQLLKKKMVIRTGQKRIKIIKIILKIELSLCWIYSLNIDAIFIFFKVLLKHPRWVRNLPNFIPTLSIYFLGICLSICLYAYIKENKKSKLCATMYQRC